nr:hypothetical protein [Natrarchaeobius chitinivorans]
MSISMVTVMGTGALTDYQDGEQINNAEVAFEILANNIDDHAYDRVEGRATEIRVTDASLSFGTREEFNISVQSSNDEIVVVNDPIIYETEQGSQVVHSNGALFRETERESRMIREPHFRIDENRTMLPQTEMRGSDTRLSIGGSETVHLRTEQRTPRLYQHSSGDLDVEIEIVTKPARADEWERYLDSFDEIDADQDCTSELNEDSTTLTCDLETDEIYVPVTRLSGEFS